MPLFGRRRRAEEAPAPVEKSPFAAEAAARGWETLDAKVFDSMVERRIHESARVLYGNTAQPWDEHYPHPTRYHDVFGTTVDGRRVVVANAWTNVSPSLLEGPQDVKGASACVVELPSVLAIAVLQPRPLHPLERALPEATTGDATFDEQYRMNVAPGFGEAVVTPEMRRLIMARDDWIFCTYEGWLVCTATGPYVLFDDMVERIDDVLAIVAAIPASVLPRRVDHSTDDLVARINRLDSVDDAIAFLTSLTPADRERLAKSDTPLALFADVTTPEDAMARFQSLDQQRQLQLITMFSRVDQEGR